MPKEKKLQPILKWAGGKRQLLRSLEKHLPNDIKKLRYMEPFFGGGALFFHLMPKKAIINDYNNELMNLYVVIKNDVYGLVEELKKFENTEKQFYEVRSWDRNIKFSSFSDTKKAARTLFLNKTCFNGLYRVNKEGYFNTPYGKYKNPKIINENLLEDIHLFFNASEIEFLSNNYVNILLKAGKEHFVYLDPPYDPISKTANFTSYTNKLFGREEQKELFYEMLKLDERGVKVMLSNSASEYILSLFDEINNISNNKFKLYFVDAKRQINAQADKRKNVKEVIITNY